MKTTVFGIAYNSSIEFSQSADYNNNNIINNGYLSNLASASIKPDPSHSTSLCLGESGQVPYI